MIAIYLIMHFHFSPAVNNKEQNLINKIFVNLMIFQANILLWLERENFIYGLLDMGKFLFFKLNFYF